MLEKLDLHAHCHPECRDNTQLQRFPNKRTKRYNMPDLGKRTCFNDEQVRLLAYKAYTTDMNTSIQH
jgi:hypothetical protein